MSDNMLSSYWDYASDPKATNHMSQGPPPPIPPRPETSGLEQLWKSYRKTVENEVAKKLGPRSGNISYDRVIGGGGRDNAPFNSNVQFNSLSSSSIRDQVAALRRDSAVRKNNYMQQTPVSSKQINNKKMSNTNTPEMRRQNQSLMSKSVPPRQRVSPHVDASPSFSISDIVVGGSCNNKEAVNQKELENANEEIERLRRKLKTTEFTVETLKKDAEKMKVLHGSLLLQQKNNASSSQEDLLLQLNRVESEFKTKEIALTKKLEESKLKQLKMKAEMKNVQKAFGQFKKNADAELSTTLVQADNTISDLSKKLKERKKMLKKFNNEVKRLQNEIEQYKAIISKSNSNNKNDNGKQKGDNEYEEEIFKLQERCTKYKHEIDDIARQNKKLQNEVDDQKVELDLNAELEEKMNVLHREHSTLEKKYQRKVADYDELKETFENRPTIVESNEDNDLDNSMTNELNRIQIELTESRQKLKFKEEECEDMMNQLDKAKKRRFELDEIVKSTKENLYDVQDQKENIELKLNRTLEERDRLELQLEKIKAENKQYSEKLKDHEKEQNESKGRLSSEIMMLKTQKKAMEETCKNATVNFETEQKNHQATKERLDIVSTRYKEATDECKLLNSKQESLTKEYNNIKISLTENQALLEKTTLEKDQLHDKCEKLEDDLTRSGSDIELNLVKADLKEIKDAFQEHKEAFLKKEKMLANDIENYKKKISNLEIEDKINKQELNKTKTALNKAKDLVKKLQNESVKLTKSQILSSSDENAYDDDFDRDSDEEETTASTKTLKKNANYSNEHKTPQSSLKNDDHDSSDISSWDSSVKKKPLSSVPSNRVSKSDIKEKKAISDMNSFFKISDDDLDESGNFGEGNSEFSFSNNKSPNNSNEKKAMQGRKNQSEFSPKPALQLAQSNEDQDINGEESDEHEEESNGDDGEEDDSEEDDSEEDDDEEDEEEKHGWEKMDHKGKEYYWNWDTEETVWERPDDYNSPTDGDSGSSDGEGSDRTNEEDTASDSKAKGKGPAALFLEHMQKTRGTDEPEDEDDEKSKFNRFLDELEEGIAIRKFPSSGKLFGKSLPQDRTIWLDRKRSVLYWQKGRKNKSKVKLESSIRLDDLISVSVGLKSEGLRKNGSNKNVDFYLTLIGKGGGRDLDIEAQDKEQRNYLANGFKNLLKTKL